MAGVEQKTVQEMAIQRWKEHRAKFCVGDFTFDDGTFGFVVADRIVQPPQFYVVGMSAEGKVRSLKGDLTAEEHVAMGLADVADMVLEGRIPSEPMGVGQALAMLGLTGERSSLVDLSIRRFTEALNDPRIAAHLPKDKLCGAEQRRFDDAGLVRMRSALDPLALEALRAVGDFKWRDYLFYAEPGEKGVIRRQAASVYPLFAALMVERPSIKGAIDRRESLADALQAAFGEDKGKPRLGKGVLKRIQGIAWPTGGLDPVETAQALAAIPADWFPKDREEWIAFCDITATVGTMLPMTTGQSIETLYAGSGGKWVDFRTRCARAYTDTRPPEGYDSDPPECLFGESLKALSSAWDWKAAAGMTPDDLRSAAATFAQDFEFPEPIERPDDYDVALVTEWLVHNSTFLRVKNAIDWKSLAKLPRDKVEAASLEAASRVTDLPSHMTREGIAGWIQRINMPDLSREALHTACVDVDDMLDSFARKVVLPVAALRSGLNEIYLAQVSREEARRAAAKVLCGGMTANAILESSRWFHSQAAAFLQAGADVLPPEERKRREAEAARAAALNVLGIDITHIPADGWAPLCPIVQAPNGVFVVPLTDPTLLQMEGRRGINADGTEGLHHCVGGYDEACRRGHHILSLREVVGNTYRRLSTCEIHPIVYGDPHINVKQHRGMNNQAIPERAARAFEWFRASLANGAITLNYDGIRRHLASIGIRADDLDGICGYDWHDASRIDRAMAPWAKLVSKPYRGMTLEQFGSEPEVVAVSEIFNPSYVPRCA